MALVFIVEDDHDIRQIEAYALKCGGFEIEEFEDAKALYERLEKKTPDLFLLDVMLPDEDGLSILRKIREKRETKRIPVIMVTAKTTEIDKVKGLDNGADDYMTKPFGVMELVSRVKALLRRTGEQDAEKVIKIGDLVIDDEKRKVFVSGSAIELTYKEYELLHYLAQNQEIVLPRDSIMEHIWHANCEIESRTLDVHIKTLRHKLGDAGKYIKTVRNVGYCMNLV